MGKESFQNVWTRIIQHAGEEFKTKRNLPFSYKIEKDTLIPSRTERNIPKKDFEKIYEKVPVPFPGKIRDDVQGPAYVWAILHDIRISQGKW